MCSLSLASVIMRFQTIINLLLLKSYYYKFHSFQIRNISVSFYTKLYGMTLPLGLGHS